MNEGNAWLEILNQYNDDWVTVIKAVIIKRYIVINQDSMYSLLAILQEEGEEVIKLFLRAKVGRIAFAQITVYDFFKRYFPREFKILQVSGA